MKTQNAYVVGGTRVPFMRSFTLYKDTTNQELMTYVLKSLVQKFNLQDKVIGDVALGAVMNSSVNWGIARESVLGSGLHPYTPAYYVQRACGTGLESTLQIAAKMTLGQIDWGIAGGFDSNSDLPLMASRGLQKSMLALNAAKTFGDKVKAIAQIKISDFKPVAPAVVEPRTGLSMGEHCEKMVKEWNISREAQDKLTYDSHQKATAAYKEGFYEDLITAYHGQNRDGIVRPETSMEKLATLKPAFDKKSGKGTLTAGNSTPLTDGASAVLLATEDKMKAENLKPLARFVDAEVAAVDYVGGDGLLMGPTVAVGRMLARNNLKLQDFDYYEIHEAFAGQVLCTLKAWESDEYCRKFLKMPALGSIDLAKMNVKGGSVALGHPFAATGGRIVSSLAKILSTSKKPARGLISICTAGGMGVAAIMETV